MIQTTPGTEGTERLVSETFAAERKKFFLDLHQNHRGQFVRITEDTNGRRDRIMVPANALRDMVEALNRIISFSEENFSEGSGSSSLI
jgi:hypothetical protein